MAKISILIALLLQLCSMVPGLAPCLDYYTNVEKPGTSEIFGQIEIPSPPKDGRFHLRVGFNTNPFTYKKPLARLELKEESVQAAQQGQPLLYHLHYATGQPIPRLTKIWFNDRQYCPNPGEVETIETNSELSHYFPENLPPRIDTSTPSSTIPPSTTPLNNECGISSYTDTEDRYTNFLVYDGKKTLPGKWPWLVALFTVIRDHEFICAGSILTNEHIITAAHCLKMTPDSNDTLPANVLEVALGRFTLRNWREAGTVSRDVARYKMHPDYAHTDSGDADLAILILRTSVDYSPVIKPICLWTGSINLDNVIGKNGTVVGWGVDEHGNYTADPRLVSVPIVKQDVCLWSHASFFRLTSERTFCAGARDGSGPCNGDSGGGLVIIDQGRYHLRGVVSRGVVKKVGEKFECDLSQYVVYLDVAKYLPWIREQISIRSLLLPNMLSTIHPNPGPTPKPTPQPTPMPPVTKLAPQYECGRIGSLDLISHGQRTSPGEWPWLVALFVVENVYKFQCGGTLLTNKHVLTAAHCLLLNRKQYIHHNVLVVSLGRFNLHQFRERGTVNREVGSYKIHPDYPYALTGDSDIAVMTLKKTVDYSVFIRPICLWSGPPNIRNVINRIGYVVGWGQDERGNPWTEDPRMAMMPIVSLDTCHRSFPGFVNLTSKRTFCARTQDGSGSCNSDSGSGLVIYDNVSRRFHLRGVVSRSELGNEPLCDLTKYVVFVDVAQYIPWIQQRIST